MFYITPLCICCLKPEILFHYTFEKVLDFLDFCFITIYRDTSRLLRKNSTYLVPTYFLSYLTLFCQLPFNITWLLHDYMINANIKHSRHHMKVRWWFWRVVKKAIFEISCPLVPIPTTVTNLNWIFPQLLISYQTSLNDFVYIYICSI